MISIRALLLFLILSVCIPSQAANANPDLIGRWPHYRRGQVRRVQVAGDYAYIAAQSGGLLIYDIRNPASPQVIGSASVPGLIVHDLAVRPNLAYLLAQNSFSIADISDPSNPQILGQTPTSGDSYGVAIRGSIAYIADGSGGLRLIDVADPANPVTITSIQSDAGQVFGLAISGDVLVLACFGGVRTFDLTDPRAPAPLGTFASNPLEEVTISGRLGVFSAGNGGMQIFDLSDPASPAQLGSFQLSGYSSQSTIQGDLVILASSLGVRIVDISNPAAPALRGETLHAENATVRHGIAAQGNYAYYCHLGIGLQVIDISNPSSPTVVGRHNPWGNPPDIAVAGNIALLADGTNGVRTFDLFDPTRPNLIATTATGSAAVSLALSGNTALVGRPIGEGIDLFDVSDPARPERLSNYPLSFQPRAILVRDQRAFVAASGVEVIDIQNPSAPTRVSNFGRVFTDDVALEGNLAFTVHNFNGMQIFDVSNLAAPVRLSGADTPNLARRVVASASHAYVLDLPDSINIFDVSSPSTPRMVRRFAPPGVSPQNISLAGNRLFIEDSSPALIAYDLTSPAEPIEVARFQTSGAANRNRIIGHRAYRAIAGDGLEILDISRAAAPSIVITQTAATTDVLISGMVGSTYTIQTATDLSVADPWRDSVSITLTSSPHQLQIDATQGNRFYRARLD